MKARSILLGGALASSTGVVIASTVQQTVGGFIVVAGWAIALYGLHAFGRTGRRLQREGA